MTAATTRALLVVAAIGVIAASTWLEYRLATGRAGR
jgi:hypothetical protein